jgi:hypothetical protein
MWSYERFSKTLIEWLDQSSKRRETFIHALTTRLQFAIWNVAVAVPGFLGLLGNVEHIQHHSGLPSNVRSTLFMVAEVAFVLSILAAVSIYKSVNRRLSIADRVLSCEADLKASIMEKAVSSLLTAAHFDQLEHRVEEVQKEEPSEQRNSTLAALLRQVAQLSEKGRSDKDDSDFQAILEQINEHAQQFDRVNRSKWTRILPIAQQVCLALGYVSAGLLVGSFHL